MLCASLAISGVPVHFRLLQQGRHPGGRLRARALDVLGRRAHRRHDGVLRLPRHVPGLLRRVSRPRASARIAAGDDRCRWWCWRCSRSAAASSTSRIPGADVPAPKKAENQTLTWHLGRRRPDRHRARLPDLRRQARPGRFVRQVRRRPLHAWSTTSTSWTKSTTPPW